MSPMLVIFQSYFPIAIDARIPFTYLNLDHFLQLWKDTTYFLSAYPFYFAIHDYEADR